MLLVDLSIPGNGHFHGGAWVVFARVHDNYRVRANTGVSPVRVSSMSMVAKVLARRSVFSAFGPYFRDTAIVASPSRD